MRNIYFLLLFVIFPLFIHAQEISNCLSIGNSHWKFTNDVVGYVFDCDDCNQPIEIVVNCGNPGGADNNTFIKTVTEDPLTFAETLTDDAFKNIVKTSVKKADVNGFLAGQRALVSDQIHMVGQQVKTPINVKSYWIINDLNLRMINLRVYSPHDLDRKDQNRIDTFLQTANLVK
ncbi:hypothetical protein [Klebsiella pneumoniae]